MIRLAQTLSVAITLSFTVTSCGLLIGGAVKGAASGGEATAGEPSDAYSDFTLGQRKHIKSQESYFKRETDDTDEVCGVIPSAIEWSSFRAEIDKRIDKEHTYSAFAFCGEPLGALRSLCREDPEYKGAIGASITSFECRFGGPEGRQIELDDSGKLIYWVDWEASNNGPYVTKFIGASI